MLLNYLTITLRSLKRQKLISFINIAGLSGGIALSVLILHFVYQEFTFDRFHQKASHIYRVTQRSQEAVDGQSTAQMPPTLAAALQLNYPEVRQTVRFYKSDRVLMGGTGSRARRQFYEDKVLFADSTFFSVFTFPLRAGDAKTALNAPRSIVLSDKTARKYFGGSNPVGQSLLLNNRELFQVTGVAAPLPSNSSVDFEMVASFPSLGMMEGHKSLLAAGWGVAAFPTYVVIGSATAARRIEKQMPALYRRYTGHDWSGTQFTLEPLRDIHLHSDAVGDTRSSTDVRYIYVFAGIAILILAIAIVNYVNLSTARTAVRTKEIGVRKIIGSTRGELIVQFLGEAALITFVAFLVAAVMIRLLLAPFTALTGRSIRAEDFYQPAHLLTLFGLAVVVSLLAGIYPALMLSRITPGEALKSRFTASKGGIITRKSLIVFQFVVSGGLIVCAFIMQNQLDYFRQKRLGLSNEQVLAIPMADSTVAAHFRAIRGVLAGRADVHSVGVASAVPTKGNPQFGVSLPHLKEDVWVSVYETDRRFFEALQIKLAAGSLYADDAKASVQIVLNETAVRKLQLPDPVGKKIRLFGQEFVIAGVVRDFHFQSLHHPIEPLLLFPATEFKSGGYFLLKTGTGTNLPQQLAALESLWKQYAPGLPFEYFFMDDAFDQLYKAEDRLAGIFSAFSVFAVFIACIGLLGLTAFAAEKRSKEAGIRKIMGAGVFDIVYWFTKDSLKLVVTAILIAFPVAWYGMTFWLRNFAYRVEPDWRVFGVAGLVVVVIALLTMSYYSIKTALANPVKTLRNE
ncbi:MAG: Acidobacterial duplicated orphan permease (function unknown) [uncultured Cytophagales bacterium]|uniref:ABC transporter, fused permease protein n=1 Tax=uncultured Cytophagales bacterium TaxID=158755 RepID=A0A6J4HIE6_9SPHI|nr:MAG: Acidobacterial duplicated orphan permease (function unknown) [uncultured Cytophagales bacterium]